MGKRGDKKNRGATGAGTASDQATKKRQPLTRSGEGGASRGRKAAPPLHGQRGFRSWVRANRSDLRFLLVFGGMMVVYYVATTTHSVKEDFFPWYLRATTQVSAGLLDLFGYGGMEARGNVLLGPRGSVTVERGCDAMAPTALFISAVVASPTLLVSKLPALLGGTLVLMVVNVIRIITLFLTRIHWPKAFDIMHLDVWQAAFIFLSILLWAFWASWTTQRRKQRSDAAT